MTEEQIHNILKDEVIEDIKKLADVPSLSLAHRICSVSIMLQTLLVDCPDDELKEKVAEIAREIIQNTKAAYVALHAENN